MSRRALLRTAYGWLALVVASPVMASEPIRLNMQKCVDIAIQNATAVLKNENDVELAGTQVLQSYGQFLPNLQAGAGYDYSSGTSLITLSGAVPLDIKSQDASLNISSTLNLFNGLADYAGLKSALARRDSSRYSLTWAKQQVALDVTQSYLQTVLDEKLLNISRKNLDASEARLKLLQGQTRAGAASIADLYRQQAQTSADQLSVSTYENRLKNDRTLLLQKIRVDLRQEYEFETPSLVAEPSPYAKRPIDELIKDALVQRTDLRSAQSRNESTDWNITQSRSGYLPKLDLVFNRASAGTYLHQQRLNGNDVLPAYQHPLWGQLGPYTTYTIALNLTWNIFDRFVTRLNTEQSRVTYENSKVDTRDVELQVETDVRTSYVDYQTAVSQVETARVGVEAAQKAYDAIVGKYQVGSASFIDVLTSQSALVQAQSNQAQALINLKLREKTVAYAQGRLLTPP